VRLAVVRFLVVFLLVLVFFFAFVGMCLGERWSCVGISSMDTAAFYLLPR
jgi:hypothetical protein